jgi:hypothetical protein
VTLWKLAESLNIRRRKEKGMKTRVTVVMLMSMTVFMAGFGLTQADDAEEQQAIAAAESWLKIVDQGKYGESWKQTAGLFRKLISETQWEQACNAVRGPLGKVLSRKVKSKKFTTQLPGAPDGKYLIIQFNTSFEHKKSAVETVTPMMDNDGKWRVSGYYIK